MFYVSIKKEMSVLAKLMSKKVTLIATMAVDELAVVAVQVDFRFRSNFLGFAAAAAVSSSSLLPSTLLGSMSSGMKMSLSM